MELCIDLGGTEIKLAATHDDRVVASSRIPVQGGPTDLADAAVGARRIIQRTGAPDAVGIAVPGVVDPGTGRMLHANAKYGFLRDRDLSAWSLAEFGVAAAVENDARAALFGETSSGSAVGARDAVLITLGTGIGTAVLMSGMLLYGRTGHAGILGGHLTVDGDGPVCPCGNIGCGEALASTWALQTSTGSATGPRQGPGTQLSNRGEITMAEVFRGQAHRGIRERYIRAWGATVTSLVHSYDPAVIILTGGILRAGTAVSVPIEAYVRAHLWRSLNPPRFIVPPEPELSVARGLSVLARTRSFRTGTQQEQP